MKNIFVYITGLILAVPTVVLAHRGWGESGNDCFLRFNRFHIFGGGPFMWILWIIILVTLGFLVYKAIVDRKLLNTGPESALDIAQKRYARGEINADEYERIRKDLQL